MPRSVASAPCEDCLRRTRIVHRLGGRLDVRHYDTERLAALFTLPEPQLIAALGLSGVADFEARYGALEADCTRLAEPAIAICRHDSRYPRAAAARASVAEAWAPPPVLFVVGDAGSLQALGEDPAVAIVGTRRATDYGLAVAYRLGRDLAAAGLPLVGPFAAGIPSAAHAGALSAGGTTVAVMPGGVDICAPAGKRALYDDIVRRSCAISEAPCGARARRWSHAASDRIVAGLACAVVVVEAEERASDLMLARFAQQIGRRVLAVPGRITSQASRGAHELIASGSPLARGARDVLDALHGVGVKRSPPPAPTLPPRDREAARVLELVAAGADTADRLVAKGIGLAAALRRLTELALDGRHARGDGGRYVPIGPDAPGSRTAL
jgi:DNA processing protein